jgi:hypothetical protein
MTEDCKPMAKFSTTFRLLATSREESAFSKMLTPAINRAITISLLMILLVGCASLTPAALDTIREPPSSIRTEYIPEPDYWRRNGYAEMVPSLRLPTTHDATDIIRVYLFVPPEKSINARYIDEEGRYTILFPDGTRADRVESLRYRKYDGELGETPMDVRGTTIEADGGARYHCLRPESGKPRAPLLGWSWSSNDSRGRREATRRLMALASRVGTPIDEPPLSGEALRALGRLNDCAHCHLANHPRETSVHAAPFPRRETDASGFYSPLSVLQSEVALAATRPMDPNAGDPFVDVRCDSGPVRLVRDGHWIWYRCVDGSVPVGRRDVRSALEAGDHYTVRVCQSRRYLHDHMDAAARRAFAASFRECGIHSPDVDGYSN